MTEIMNARQSQSETKDTSFEQRPNELMKLEVGSGGLSGFDLSELKKGTTIVTVDGIGHNSQTSRKGEHLYDTEIDLRKHDMLDLNHVAIVGDGRELPFADNTFSDVLMANVISDPSVEAEDTERLIVEALRVGERLILTNDNTEDIAQGRLNGSNLEDAGIVRTTIILRSKEYDAETGHHRSTQNKLGMKQAYEMGVSSTNWGDQIEILTKADNYGTVPLEIPDENQIHGRQEANLLREQIEREKQAAIERQARRKDFRDGVKAKLTEHVHRIYRRTR
jgi:hypothetical protein